MNVPMKPTRDGFGEALVEIGARNEKLVVIGCDISDSVRTLWFAEKFPDRFFSVGIAEQNAACVAGGLALAGYIPVFSTYGVFASGRAFDQIRTSIAYAKLNVKICGAHGGISVGPDGATHQALEEIAAMRVLPNMVVIAPCDSNQTKKATEFAIEKLDGPVYIRTGRAPVPLFTDLSEEFTFGKASVRREGNDLAIIACGGMVWEAMQASEILEKDGIKVRVLDLATIKPIDKEAIISAAKECGRIMTVEEHQIAGGMGSAVAEVVVQYCPVPIKFIGIHDRFGESGEPDELQKLFGLTGAQIAETAREFLK